MASAQCKLPACFIIWSLTGFVCEIPAGSIADKFSRRHVLVLGIALQAIGYSFWLFMPNYLGFMIGFILWGIKGALVSGTMEALIYDELNRVKQLPTYAKLTGRMKSIGAIAAVLACFAAAPFAHTGYTIVLVLSITSIIISGVAIYLLPRSAVSIEAEEAGYLSIIREGVGAVLQEPLVFFLVAFMSIVAGMGSADEYMDLLLREKGFSNTAVVIWAAIIYLFGAFGSMFAHKLEGRKLPIHSALFAWAVLLFFASIAPKFLAPFLLGVYVMFFFGAEVLFNAYLQREIGDKTRATTTSVGGFFAELFAIIGFLVMGFGADRANYAFGFQLVAVSTVAFGIFLTLYSRRYKLRI